MSRPLLIGSLSIGLAMFTFLWFHSDESNLSTEEQHSLKQIASPTTTADINLASSHSNKPDMSSNASLEEIQIASQVESALQQYDEFSKYPPSSQPIVDEAQLHTFTNTGTPQTSLPFPFDDLETPIQASVELDQNNYFFGDQIKAKINVSQIPEGSALSVRSTLMSIEGETVAESPYQETVDQTTYVVFDTQSFTTRNWPSELNVAAYIDVGGRSIFITAPFKINDESASLDSVGFSEPVAENLQIPLNLNVKLAGYYHVTGVLFSANSQQPLIHLETEGRLEEGMGSLLLKAHIQALKKAADEGPYFLDSIKIERWSDETIPRDIAGKVDQSEYKVDGYSFHDYEDKPYLDPLAEERKKLLQGLSSRL